MSTTNPTKNPLRKDKILNSETAYIEYLAKQDALLNTQALKAWQLRKKKQQVEDVKSSEFNILDAISTCNWDTSGIMEGRRPRTVSSIESRDMKNYESYEEWLKIKEKELNLQKAKKMQEFSIKKRVEEASAELEAKRRQEAKIAFEKWKKEKEEQKLQHDEKEILEVVKARKGAEQRKVLAQQQYDEWMKSRATKRHMYSYYKHPRTWKSILEYE